MCFCCGFTQFHFYYGHAHGRIWNPPLRSANPVAFCLPPTSAGWGHPALRPTKKGNVGRPALWPPCPLPATANLPCNPPTLTPQTKASLVKGRCRACEAEGFLPVCGCDSVQGIARQNPSGRLRRPPPFDKGGWTVEKLHPCLIACVGATMGRPLAYRRNAISGTVFIQGKRARASNARPYKRVSTRFSHLKLHFKFHSCKIRQSVLQSHSIPF